MQLRYWSCPDEFYRDKDFTDAYLEEAEGGMPLIRFRSLEKEKWLAAAFSTRYGGVSTGVLSELNLGFGRGDVPLNVRMNFHRIADRLGVSPARLALTEQVHETHLMRVDDSLTVGEHFIRKIHRTDGLYTDVPGIVLTATFADCVPIYLADPVKHTIALVHSGWKGTVGKIGAEGVRAMQCMGSRPEDLIAVIGPCISAPHYEVTGEVIRALERGFSPEAMKDIAKQTDDLHWQCDLPAACWYVLTEAGVPGTQIHFSGICTYENPEILFSHRFTAGQRGNVNAFLSIREEGGRL